MQRFLPLQPLFQLHIHVLANAIYFSLFLLWATSHYLCLAPRTRKSPSGAFSLTACRCGSVSERSLVKTRWKRRRDAVGINYRHTGCTRRVIPKSFWRNTWDIKREWSANRSRLFDAQIASETDRRIVCGARCTLTEMRLRLMALCCLSHASVRCGRHVSNWRAV